MDHRTDRSPHAAKWQAALFALVLLPFACAVVAHARGPKPQRSEQRGESAGLVFDQYLVNLGEVPPLPVLEGRFRFTNRSDRTVTIKELQPSCGCLNPRLKKRVYEPGEEGEFSVRVQTAGETAGQKEYFVDVAFEDSQPRKVQLAFEFVLPERKVVVHPRGLVFYQLSPGATRRKITVTDFRDEPLRVTDWECESPFVSASIAPAAATSFGQLETIISVTVADGVPEGRHEALLILKTDDPDFPTVRVPVWIEGPKSGLRAAGGERGGKARRRQ